ncbi:MAG: ATP-binding protein [Thermoanaerobaculia bacterium]|nr:ATP-binding protein [Thermoanaerobaculia bacterium]
MSNHANLTRALALLRSVIAARLQVHLGQEESLEVETGGYYQDGSPFARFMDAHEPSFEEYIVLLLALAPRVQPAFFSRILAEFLPEGGDFPELGGARTGHHRGIQPTGETAQFILAGDDLEKRLEVQAMLGGDHWFAQKQILALESVREGEPPLSGRLILDDETAELLSAGQVSKPRFGADFPAERIETGLEWPDLVLHPNTLHQIREIEKWIKWSDTLMNDWGMRRKVKPGYRSLFYGPPGTGKTLTATLLGKYTGRDVFRIDLSRVISKYIGETEKNLAKLFDKAESKDWILFFDEADALFGKRTGIRDAHDKYANQEVAYLLQRVETYDGLVILASNQRVNIDEAFTRRFQSVIHFPMPRPEERLELWRKAFPPQIAVAEDVDWKQIATQYELSGASIINITQFCALEALADQTNRLDRRRLEAGILREFVKEGKVV